MKKTYLKVVISALCIALFAAAQTTAATTAPVKTNAARQAKALAAKYRNTMFDRFLTYVSYNRQSSETEQITPDQIETAQKLYAEIKAMGLPVSLSQHHYIFVELPSNLPWEAPTLGFSAHYDVTPGIEADNIKAIVHRNYDGTPIVLQNNQVIDPAQPNGEYLPTQVGKTVVTSDGNTILGADDGAGMAILMTFLQTIAENPKKLHGKIQIVIAPNEDVGRAAEFIEETPYDPDIAFDFDGGSNGRLVVENFNARQEIFTVTGVPGHQSYAATNGYRNAWTPACELGQAICPAELMANFSSGRQGYAELHHMSAPGGKVSMAELDVRLRGFDSKEMDKWEHRADSIAQAVAKQYEVAITRKMIDNYKNVAEVSHPQALEISRRAFANAGVEPRIESARAGTTASMFVTKGLKGAYTIFTGQNNPHNYTEWLSEEDMYNSYVIALNLVDEVAKLRIAK